MSAGKNVECYNTTFEFSMEYEGLNSGSWEIQVDAFYRYGTDGNAAVRAGNNLRAAAFGMAVYCSHGMERTHVTGLENTMNLLLAYVLDI